MKCGRTAVLQANQLKIMGVTYVKGHITQLDFVVIIKRC